MTADELRLHSKHKANTLTGEARSLYGRWQDAILRAADRGETIVLEGQVEQPPAPASKEARTAALNQLLRDGFNVVFLINVKGQVAQAQVTW